MLPTQTQPQRLYGDLISDRASRSMIQQFDELDKDQFCAWHRPNSPVCAVGMPLKDQGDRGFGAVWSGCHGRQLLGQCMYETHFGFQSQPFQAGNAVRYYFESASSKAAIPQLRHALRSDPGVAVLTGPAGSGKSALLKHLQQNLALNGRALLCSAASLASPGDLFEFLGSARPQPTAENAECPPREHSRYPSRWAIREMLQRSSQFWGPVLLLLDDAQLLPVSVLNELKAFIDDVSDGGPLLRTVIAGPLSLEEDLARPSHTEFSHRLRCHVFLEPLTMRESADYLRQQIELVGGNADVVFDRQVVEQILQASGGIPRCINLLGDETLLEAARRELSQANASCVQAALQRLIHLPYEWDMAAMPLDDCDQETDDFEDFAEPNQQASHATSDVMPATVANVVEFGGDEVEPQVDRSIESGRPVVETSGATAFVEVGAGCGSESPAAVRPTASTEIGGADHDVVDDIASSVAEPEPLHQSLDSLDIDAVESAVANPRVPHADSSFEIGYSNDECDSGGEQNPDLEKGSADSDSAGACFAPVIHTEQAVVVELSAPATESPQASSPATTEADNDTEFSETRTVFDRYTCVALHRDVPPGQLPPTGSQFAQDITEEFAVPGELHRKSAFDAIVVHESTDAAITKLVQPEDLSESVPLAFVAVEEKTEDWVDGQLLADSHDDDRPELSWEPNPVNQTDSEPITQHDASFNSRHESDFDDCIEVHRSSSPGPGTPDTGASQTESWYAGAKSDVASITKPSKNSQTTNVASVQIDNSEDVGVAMTARRLFGLDIDEEDAVTPATQHSLPGRMHLVPSDSGSSNATRGDDSRKLFVESPHIIGERDAPDPVDNRVSGSDSCRFDTLFSDLRRMQDRKSRSVIDESGS
jgi:type II secretory pathway predicted ATPase ExeA